MDYGHVCAAVEAEIAAFAQDVRGSDPVTPVRTCPPWDLAELLRHIGSIHRWAGQMVRDKAPERLSFRSLDLQLPSEPKDYPDWLAAGGTWLAGIFRTADPDAPTWAWGADQHAQFWGRRMLHETTVHRADALLALGRDPRIESARAVDGIDEFLENLPHAASFAPNVKDIRGDGETLHFHCTDAEGEWMIQLNPQGFSWEHGHGKGSIAVRGAAADLLLLVYGRLKPADERFERFGDEAVLERWLTSAHF
ncbi:MAG TPA: maleylpyruvate isomerase family mycothiol-dependent enzyme [Chloroflexota bacterium]